MAIKYLLYNKKRSSITIFSIVMMTILFLNIGFLFSSFRDYIIKDTKETKGDYHVLFKTTNSYIGGNIKKIVTKNGMTYITFRDINKTYAETKKNCQEIKCEDIKYNDSLLSLYGLSKKENIIDVMKKSLIVILIILSVGVAFLLYNSFNISVAYRKRQFSLLKSIGMTKLQLKKMILKESSIILLIGLIIGILMSLMTTGLLLKLFNKLLSDFFITKLNFSFYPSFVILPLIFIIIIVLVSAYIPAYQISKKNIVEVIKNNEGIKIQKNPKYFKNYLQALAQYNYLRNKKKYWPIIICLFINIILYVSFSLYLNYGIKGLNEYTNIPDYKTQISVLNAADGDYKLLEILSINSEKYGLYKSCVFPTHIEKKYYLKNSEKYYKKDKNLLLISSDKQEVINKIKEVKTNKNNVRKIDTKYLKKEINIGDNTLKTTTKIPYGIESLLTSDTIVMTTDKINNYCQNFNIILFLDKEIDGLEGKIKKLNTVGDIEYVNIAKATRLMNNILFLVKLSLYTVIVLVTIIGITSIINTIFTSMDLRGKEFGVLFSLGMTNKQLSTLLFYEGGYIVLKSFIYTLPFISLIYYLLSSSFKEVFQSLQVNPLKEIIISFIVSLIIVYGTMIISHLKLKNKAIISSIRNENI